MDAADILMSPEFGAFGGLHEQQNSIVKGLDAQIKLGEVAGLPALQRQREAHARLFESQAAEHEEGAAAQKRMAALMAGQMPGTDDKPVTPTSLAENMTKLSKAAFSSGLYKQGVDLAGKAATIFQHVAATDASNASVELRKARATQAVLDQVGGLASSVTDQTTYDLARISALSDPNLAAMMKQRGFDPSKLPEDYESAKPFLASLQTSTMKAKDVLAAKEKKRFDDAEIAKFSAQAGAAGASAEASRARADVLKLRKVDIEKNGGDTSNGARQARRDAADARVTASADREKKRLADAARQAALDAKRFAPPSAEQIKDPTKLKVGETYSTPKGALTWTGKGWVKPGGGSVTPLRVSTLVQDPDGHVLTPEERAAEEAAILADETGSP